MSEELLSIAREYLEGATTTEISDDVIERMLNKYRGYIHDKQIIAEDYYYDNVSRVYKIGYMYLMNVVLDDKNDDVIASTNYTVDVFNGIVNFNAGYTIPDTVYATFNYYNFMQAIAECWQYLGAKAKFSGKAQLGDEIIPEDRSNREYCIRRYWEFCQSENIQMER
jgi:hypothetical protein